jgi:glutamyl-Q tRNA(Asp) synthetase
MSVASSAVGRFAPSPSGALHLGSLLAAVASWLSVKAVGGSWLVRIEDLDTPRVRAGAEAQILATLKQFGLHADGPIWRQSARTAAYDLAFAALVQRGRVYPCSCTRAELLGHAVYPGFCRAGPRDPDRPLAWRFQVDRDEIAFIDALRGPQRSVLTRDVGDFIVKRADGLFAYQLAVVVDDAAQRVTEVIRGGDLLDATARQIALQSALGLPTPRYAHVPLLTHADGRKLSKSLDDWPIDSANPLPLLQRVLGWLQLPAVGDTPEQMLSHAAHHFRWVDLPSAIVVAN